jgi:transposase
VLAFFQKLPACLVGIEACASSHHWSRARLEALGAQLRRLKERFLEFDRMAWHRSNEASKRLDAIPGVGPMLASALVARKDS